MPGYTTERILGRITRIYAAAQKDQVPKHRLDEYERGLPMWFSRLAENVGFKVAREMMKRLKIPAPVFDVEKIKKEVKSHGR